MAFERDGAVRFDRAALSLLDRVCDLPDTHQSGRPGIRLYGSPGLGEVLSAPPLVNLAQQLSDRAMRPVRAILFDKTPGANWSLGWHQDRTIAVQQKRVLPGFEKWTRKAGVDHVEPPFALLERMITLRIHLDPVPPDNAPLLVIPGSHRLGLIKENSILGLVASSKSLPCHAEAGDVWAYATPILHASTRSRGHSTHRRVLQVDYSADRLPMGLEWLGV